MGMSDAEEPAPGDAKQLGPAGVGEDVCPECGGSGKVDGEQCPYCSGRGKILVEIAGA